jgi:hypothetical protein
MKVRYTPISIVFLTVYIMGLNLAVCEEFEDMVRGGDFENGDADKIFWTLQTEGQAAAILTIDKKESAVGGASLYAEVIAIDNAAPWVPWIWQTQTVEKGETYTLSVFLKAEEERSIDLSIRDLVAPKQEHVIKSVMVGTEWEEFWATFTSPKDVDVKVGVRGGPAVSFWIDGITFYEGEYEPTEVGGRNIAVAPMSKRATTWASIKAQD